MLGKGIHVSSFMIPRSNGLNSGRNVLFGFAPSGASPLPTAPVFFKSMCQLSTFPCAFFSVKAKMAPACLMATFRSLSSARDWLIRSNALEDGKSSTAASAGIARVGAAETIPFFNDILTVTVTVRCQCTVSGDGSFPTTISVGP